MSSAQNHEQDGINYTITALEDGAYWIGRWFCNECGLTSTSSKQCRTENDAYFAAKSNLQGHHSTVHKKDKD